ncbi:MAG: hypothetical protein AAFY11_10905, partial [Cyanobacteria bacterium J06641_5]
WAIDNLEQMSVMGARGAAYVNSQHSWEKIAAANLAAYHRVLSQPTSSFPAARPNGEVVVSKQSQSR